jgi:superfamily II DNA or RNA helicase
MRKHRIMSLANGSINVLTSCDIVSEGTDIPVVTAAILLRYTASTGLYLQQCGRVLRPHPGKTNAIILDHVGNCLRHGMPDDKREWTLSGYVKPKRNGEKTAPVRVCQKCYAVFSIGRLTCPQCGFAVTTKPKKIEQQDGELVLANPEDIEIERQRLNMKREQGMAKSLEDLLHIAEKRGYKRDWAYHIYNARNIKQQREYAAAF